MAIGFLKQKVTSSFWDPIRGKLFSILLLASTLPLAACSAEIKTVINPDGSGELTLEVGLEPADIAQLADSKTSPTNLCSLEYAVEQGALTQLAPQLELRGDEIWCVTAISFENTETLSTMLGNIKGITVNKLEIADNRLIYDLTINLTKIIRNAGYELPVTRLRWRLGYPGSLAGHNADRAVEDILTWRLDPNETRTIRAESALKTPSTTIAGVPKLSLYLVGIASVCGMLLLVFGAIGWRWVRRRRR